MVNFVSFYCLVSQIRVVCSLGMNLLYFRCHCIYSFVQRVNVLLVSIFHVLVWHKNVYTYDCVFTYYKYIVVEFLESDGKGYVFNCRYVLERSISTKHPIIYFLDETFKLSLTEVVSCYCSKHVGKSRSMFEHPYTQVHQQSTLQYNRH